MADKSPSIDFTTFILSLASSAMLNLGRMPDPTGEGGEPDLDLARQSIDLLAMLCDKTSGNLTDEEAKLLRRLLHDLRIAWIEESGQKAS